MKNIGHIQLYSYLIAKNTADIEKQKQPRGDIYIYIKDLEMFDKKMMLILKKSSGDIQHKDLVMFVEYI
jgi:hypothetical protein